MSFDVTIGGTSISTTVRIIDSTDHTPETGVVYNDAGLSMWYCRVGTEAKQTITLAAGDTDSYTSGGFVHLGDGVYKIDVPNTAWAAPNGGDTVKQVSISGTQTGMIFSETKVNLLPSTGTITADVVSISGSTAAADNLEVLAAYYPIGTITSAESPTTTTFTTDLTALATGVFNSSTDTKRNIVILDGTLKGESKQILTFVSTNGKFTLKTADALSAAPAVGVKVLVL